MNNCFLIYNLDWYIIQNIGGVTLRGDFLMKKTIEQRFSYYPSVADIDGWIKEMWDETQIGGSTAKILDKNGFDAHLANNHNANYFRYVEFSRDGKRPFYGYWQPAMSTPAPLIIHVPGYGAEISFHPEFVAAGNNVLHICPQGYVTPDGPDVSLQVDNFWPVLPNTVKGKEDSGYRAWLLDCMAAITWCIGLPQVLEDRISFIGTSQGGGGSLLLASIYKEKGARCVCADVPFLTNFPLADFRGGYMMAKEAFDHAPDEQAAWRNVGYIDTLSHAHRLTMPVMLTSGEKDDTCPPDTIESLFDKLTGTKSYTQVKGMGHCYSREMMQLSLSWFRMFG